MFAFAKSKFGENEIWVQLIEKAWAKICGSYESCEMGKTSEFVENFLGLPTKMYWTEDYESEIGQESLLKILQEADNKSYIMCGSIMKKMKESLKKEPKGFIQSKGLKNCHSYTVIDVREVLLETGDLEYMVFVRNPTGNIYNKKNEIWNGDYSPMSDKWTPKVRAQCNYWVTEAQIKQALAAGRIELSKNGGKVGKDQKRAYNTSGIIPGEQGKKA